jgi:hypothetical protein
MKLNLLLLSATALFNAATAKELAVELQTAGNYAILAQSGISTVAPSVITGNIAVSPIAGTAMTGFDLIIDSGGRFSKATQVSGQCFASDYAAPIPTHLTSAVGAMGTAYSDAEGRPNTDAARINLGGGLLGGVSGGAAYPLTPGVYTFGTGVSIREEIFFEGTGLGTGEGDTDVFIIQMTGNLLQAANTDVILTNGALAKNIIWQVAGYVDVGAGAHLEGIVLVKTDALFKTGSSLNGRVLAQTACNLQSATITEPISP